MTTMYTLLAMSIALGADDDDLLLYCPYDGSADATYARGDQAATCAIAPGFGAGVRGRALLIGGKIGGEQKIVNGVPVVEEKGRNACYSPRGNFDIEEGTISFWLKPLDWSAATKGFSVVFYTHAGKNYFQIYKFWSDERFQLIRGKEGEYTAAVHQIGGWKPGQWRHVAVTWSAVELRMFVDGRMVCAHRTRFPITDAERIEPLSVGPGGAWEKGYNGLSLVDEFRVHGRPLSQREVVALYEQCADNVDRTAGLITIGERTPTLDGKIGEFEYSFAGTGFTNTATGMLAVRQSRYFLSYDRDNLYFALQSDLGQEQTGHRAELFVSASKEGAVRRYVFTPDDQNNARQEAEVKALVADGVWTLETAIPFASLGVDSAPDGKDWRINIARIISSPAAATCVAPAAGSPATRGNLMTLAFRPGAPAIRLAELFDLEKHHNVIDLSARPQGSDAHIDAVITSDTTQQYGMRTDSFTLFAKGRSTPLRAPKPPRRPWPLTPFALYDLQVLDRSDGARKPLFQAKFIYEQQTPLKMEFLYTLGKERLLVAAKRRADGRIRVRFLRPDGSEAWSVSRDIPSGSDYFKVAFDLDFGKLSPDDYTVKIDHVAPNGAETEIWEQAYQVPAINSPILREYLDEEEGLVPKPWTPVRADRGRAIVWGRQYDFSDGFLFSSLKSQGQELLAGPAALRLGGQPLELRNGPKPMLLSRDDLAVVFSKNADFGALHVSSEITAHFDGYCDIRMTVTPAGQEIEAAGLSLDIPLRSSAVTLVRDSKISTLVGGKSGAVGDYWCQDLADGPFFWVGNDRTGFNWLAPSLEEWRFKRGEKNVEIIRRGEVTTVRLNLIDYPTELDGPVTIRFGFALTPTRALDRKLLRRRLGRDWQKWIQPWKYFGVPDYDTADRGKIEYRGRGFDEVFLYMGEYAAPFCPEYPFWEEEWRLLLPKKGHTYGEWANRGRYSDVKLRDWCCYVSNCIHSKTFRNYILHKRHEFFTKAKTPLTPKAINYYFDTGVGSPPCQNAHHGCQPWLDADGRPHGRMAVDGYRKIVLDTYRMIRRTGPDAKIMSHYGWVRCTPMQHFTDIIIGGEGVENMVASKGSYYDLLTPEMFRATFSPYIYGVKTAFLNMLARAAKSSPDAITRFAKDPEAQRATRHVYGYSVAHDVGIWDSHKETRVVREAVWKAQDQLGWDEDVRFHPYWDGDTPVRLVSPQSSRILASAYTRQGRLLLAILNDTDEVQHVEIELDLNKLGVEPGLVGQDAFNPSKTYALGATWRDTVPPRGLRLVVWPRRY